MLESMAPLLIGAVVGCLIFYFIRRYNKFTPSMLVAILFHRGKIRDKGEFDRMPPEETGENR